MVSIFTYRDERKLFAVVGTVIVAAVIALIQLDALKAGKPSLINIAVGSAALYLQTALAAGLGGLRNATDGIAAAPHLYADNAELRGQNERLRAQNARLSEALARTPGAAAIAHLAATQARGGIVATAIGYDPENVLRSVTIDKGSAAGVRRDDGVVNAEGVVGRVTDVTPFESTVLLLTDAGSKVPAVVQRGRWWGIATGTDSRVRIAFVSQDAKLKVGDLIVTGEGRSFHAGFPIGRITHIDHPEGSLYQAALLEPAAGFGRLGSVVVLHRGPG